MSDSVLIWGASGHAMVVYDILESSGLSVCGFYNNTVNSSETSDLYGHPVYYGDGRLRFFFEQGIRKAIVAIGDCKVRCLLAEQVVSGGISLVTAIHPSAVVSGRSTISDGTVIAAGCIVNPESHIGKNVIINTAATVDHECIIEDGVHLSPGVHLGGGCNIGRETWVGIGAVVKDHVKIGKGCIIGAGSVVLDDIPDHQMAYGTPARNIRSLA